MRHFAFAAAMLAARAALAGVTTWTILGPMPTPLENFAIVASQGQLYLIGGYDGSTTFDTTWRAPLDAAGLPGSWVAGPTLPGASAGHAAALEGLVVYALGGNGTAIYTGNTTGTLASWTSAGSLPEARTQGAAFVSNGRLYYVGGSVAGTSYPSAAISGAINAGGSIGTFRQEAALPGGGRSIFGFATSGSRIYVIGGFDGAAKAEVFTADAASGLGTFAATTPLPSARYASCAVAHQGWVYVFGGAGAGGYLKEVLAARILADGTLGAWFRQQDLSWDTAFCSASVVNGAALVAGGIGEPNNTVRAGIVRGTLTSPGPAAQIAFTTAPLALDQLACSAEVGLELRDANGTPVGADKATELEVSFTGAQVALYDAQDTACGNAHGPFVTVPAGSSTARFRVAPISTGNISMQVLAPGLAPASQQITVTALPPVAGDPRSINGYGCGSAPAPTLAALGLAILALRRRRVR